MENDEHLLNGRPEFEKIYAIVVGKRSNRLRETLNAVFNTNREGEECELEIFDEVEDL